MKKGLTQLDTTKYFIFRPTVDKAIWSFLTKKSGRKLGRMQVFRDDMLRLAVNEKPLSLSNRAASRVSTRDSVRKHSPVYYLVPAEDVELAEALERHSEHTGSVARLLTLLAIELGYDQDTYSELPSFMLMPAMPYGEKDESLEHPRRWSAEWLQKAIMLGLVGIHSKVIPDISSGQRVKLAMPQGDMPAPIASALLTTANHLQICPEQIIGAALLRGTEILKDSRALSRAIGRSA